MKLLETSGIWEGFVPDMGLDENYKFAIHTQDGRVFLKADPYAFHAQLRPDTASVTADIDDYPWQDGRWNGDLRMPPRLLEEAGRG